MSRWTLCWTATASTDEFWASGEMWYAHACSVHEPESLAAPLVAYLSATWCTCHGTGVHHEVHLPWYRPAVRRQVGAQRRQRRALCHDVATNTYKIFAMRCKASMIGLRQGINEHMQPASCMYATPAMCSARNLLQVHSPLVKSTCPRVKATCPLVSQAFEVCQCSATVASQSQSFTTC